MTAVHIVDLYHPQLRIDQLHILPGESWCIYGPNRSGVDQLVDLFSNRRDGYTATNIQIMAQTAVVSFRLQQELFEQEVRNDDSDFLGRPDPGTLVRQFLPCHRLTDPLLAKFKMAHLLDHGYRQLSSGQCRKLLILRELLMDTKCLVLQNPFDGLDLQSCTELDRLLGQLVQQGLTLVITVNNTEDIPTWCSHLAVLEAGQLRFAGVKKEVLPQLTSTTPSPAIGSTDYPTSKHQPAANDGEELVALTDGQVVYGQHRVFTGLDLTIRSGDHTLITGPNGCGKSSLLDIITGDNQQCYANTLRLFGRPRGSGESIWELKKHMGIVSPALHRDHRVPGSGLQIVLSGLFDSIGLYRRPHQPDIRRGRYWLAWLGLNDAADIPFRRLTFSEQRLVLIGRALIKEPKLLVLDEPTQGLDSGNRHRFLDLLARIAGQNLCTLLYVSHRQDEYREFFKQHFDLNHYSV